MYVNTSTAGEIVATWQSMGHYGGNYAGRSTFQRVIRSDQARLPGGQARIGFFYGDISDNSRVSAGFGDGLSRSNEGEVAFATLVPGTSLGNSSRFSGIAGGLFFDDWMIDRSTVVQRGLSALRSAIFEHCL